MALVTVGAVAAAMMMMMIAYSGYDEEDQSYFNAPGPEDDEEVHPDEWNGHITGMLAEKYPEIYKLLINKPFPR